MHAHRYLCAAVFAFALSAGSARAAADAGTPAGEEAPLCLSQAESECLRAARSDQEAVRCRRPETARCGEAPTVEPKARSCAMAFPGRSADTHLLLLVGVCVALCARRLSRRS